MLVIICISLIASDIEHIPQESHNSKRYMQPSVHSSTIYNNQYRKQHTCPTAEEWIKKM